MASYRHIYVFRIELSRTSSIEYLLSFARMPNATLIPLLNTTTSTVITKWLGGPLRIAYIPLDAWVEQFCHYAQWSPNANAEKSSICFPERLRRRFFVMTSGG